MAFAVEFERPLESVSKDLKILKVLKLRTNPSPPDQTRASQQKQKRANHVPGVAILL
ncbi:MAG: hypothetical protein Crog4KO_36670 [Crocinitomicaceae bacterium]